MKRNAVNDGFRILRKALTKEQLNEIRRDGFLDMGQMQALAEDSGLDIELIQEIVRQMDQVWLMSGGLELELVAPGHIKSRISEHYARRVKLN